MFIKYKQQFTLLQLFYIISINNNDIIPLGRYILVK